MTPRSVLGFAIALGLLCAVSAAAAVAWRNYRAVYLDYVRWPVSAEAAHPELAGIPNLREVRFKRRDGEAIAGWYAPTHNGATILLMHGTNADRATVLPETRSLAAAGFGVLAFDWAGYGFSGGRADWGPGERSALIAALDWLSAQPGVDPRRIGAYGFSMGSYSLAQTAALDSRIRAVVLAGVPNDLVKDSRTDHRKWGPLSAWPARWAFDGHFGDGPDAVSAALAASRIAPRPLLVIGGSADTVVSERVVREVYDAAHEPKDLWIIPGAQHGEYPQAAGDAYGNRLASFFGGALGVTEPSQ